MATKTHTTIRNKNLFCLHCGKEWVLKVPVGVTEMIETMKTFNELHKNCKPEWKQPEPDMATSVLERVIWWTKHGDHGTSSQTMWCVLTKIYPDFKFNYEDLIKVLISEKEYTHPLDPNDFYRCYMLLKAVPEWRNELHKLNRLSVVWEKLVENWDKLTLLLEHQIKTNKPNDMYEIMKNLGC